jgi:crotonobetainyl-CoA:carnitine CoA-transferase CaiB-like acyl-CoA transferase
MTVRPAPRAAFAAVLAALLHAGPAAADDGPSNVEKCSRKLGVIAVAEPQQGWSYLSQYQLGSPAALLRMMVQNSGCFDVVERGAGLHDIQQERSLAEGGELRAESNVGITALEPAGVPCGPINRLDEVFADPQVIARGLRIDLPHAAAGTVPGVANPLRMSASPVAYDRAPPGLGEHTREVIAQWLK